MKYLLSEKLKVKSERFAATIILLLMAVIPVQAQTESQAFYIYQNDGHFDGFFYDEIEKMSFSFLDTLGVEHDEIVSQEIVTADSTYRIMLSAIDSIGFVQPPIELNGGIRNMREEGMTDYIISSDDEELIIYFYGNIPSYLCPNVGETLIDFDHEHGFGGKVTSVSFKDDMIVVKCDPLTSLKDIFHRFVCVEEYGHNLQGELVRRRVAGMPQLTRGKWDKSPKRASEDFDFSLFDINFGGHIPVGIEGQITMTFDINAHVAMTLKGSYNINYIDPIYIGLLFTSDVSFGLGVTIDGKLATLIDVGTDFIPGLPIPAAAPIFEIRNIPGLFARGEAHMKFTAGLVDVPLSQVWHKLEFNDDWIPSFTYGNNPGASKPEKKIQSGMPPLDTYLEFNGFLQAGVHAPLTLSTNRWLSKICKAEFGTHLYIGPKLTGNIQINFADMMKDGPSLYNALKNSALALTPLSIDFETKATMSGWWGNKKEITFGDGSVKVLDDRSLYLLPQFGSWQNYVNPVDGHEYAAIMCENKATIMPYQVGIRFYKKDKKGNITGEYADIPNQLTYETGARWLGSIDPMDHPNVDLEAMEPGSYVFRPLYRVANLYLEGSPEFTYEADDYSIHLSSDTIYVDWEGNCVSPITILDDYDEFRVDDDDNIILTINGKSISCKLKNNHKNYCVFDSIRFGEVFLNATKKKASGKVKTYNASVMVIQLPKKIAELPDYYDASALRNYPRLTTPDLVSLTGEVNENILSVEGYGSRIVKKDNNSYDDISWEFSLGLEIKKCYQGNLGMDTVVVNSGHYNLKVKSYYREHEGSPYYLTSIHEQNAPNLIPTKAMNNYLYADGQINIAGEIEGATYSNKVYDWEGHLTDEWSGDLGEYFISLVYKDSEAYNNCIKNGGSVEEPQ